MVDFPEHLLKLATFNIRYAPFDPTIPNVRTQVYMPGKGEAPWATRLPLIADQVKWEMPDIIGFQEALDHQYEDLKVILSQHYDSIGVGRDDGLRRGEYVPIFWRSDKFKSIHVEHFWLSDDPDVPGSIGWDAGQTRMVTLVHFQPLSSDEAHSSDGSFYVMNTHFDDRGYKSRIESAKLILKKANEITKETSEAIILMGDFNAPRTEEAYQVLTGKKGMLGCATINRELMMKNEVRRFEDCRDEVDRPYGASEATFTGFDGNLHVAQVIDYILFLSPINHRAWKTIKYGVIPNQFSPQQPFASDHRLVCALIHTAL